MNLKKDETKVAVQHTSLTEILAHLADSAAPLVNAELGELSDLSVDETKQFEAAWALLGIDRKREILARLQEMTEDNIEFNFDRIYRNAIYDLDDTVRREAVEGLWENTEPSLIRPLMRLVQQDPSQDVRAAAASALGRFSLLAEHGKISSDNRARISQTLLGVVHSPAESAEVRRRALEALAPLSLPEVTQAIWEAYRKDEQGLKISSIYAMGRNCDMLWMPTVLNEMASDDPEMRYEAATSAGEMGEAEAVPRLIDLTQDDDMEVKMAAILALGKVGGQEAKQRLRVISTNKSQAIRDAAETALKEMEAYEEPTAARPAEFDEAGVDEANEPDTDEPDTD